MNIFRTALSGVAVVSGVFFLQGCGMDVKDGRVPQEYLSQTEQLAGEYSGQVTLSNEALFSTQYETVNLKMNIKFDGDRPKVQLSKDLLTEFMREPRPWTFIHGSWVGAQCDSFVGNLEWIGIEPQKKVGSADFHFYQNHCTRHRIGNHIRLEFENKNGKPELRFSYPVFDNLGRVRISYIWEGTLTKN